jgi:hypothetical protein
MGHKALTITGHTRHDIEEQTGVPAREQREIVNGPDRRPSKYRTKEPPKLSKRDVRMMIRHLSKSPKNRRTTWQQLAEDHGGDRPPHIVKKALNDAGYYKCNTCKMIRQKQHDCAEGRA